MNINKDDLYTILVLLFVIVVLYIALVIGAGERETSYIIAEMGEETYDEIKETLVKIGEEPTQAKIANYYEQYYK